MTLELNLQKELVGHWTCDNRDIDGGILYDRGAVFDPDATIGGGITTDNTGSPIGEHTESDGTSNSYIGTRYVLTGGLNGGISVTGWVKDIGNVNGRYFSTDLSEFFGAWNDGTIGDIRFSMVDNSGNRYAYTHQIGTGTWHHFAMVWDHTVPEYRVYINGVQQHSTSISNSTFGRQSITRYLILHDGSESDSYNTNQDVGGDSGLSDFRVYHRPITEEEINALYQMREQKHYNV
jgi:hypothetical protein